MPEMLKYKERGPIFLRNNRAGEINKKFICCGASEPEVSERSSGLICAAGNKSKCLGLGGIVVVRSCVRIVHKFV